MRISDWSSDVCSSDLFAYGPKNSKQLLLFNHDPAEPGPPPALLGYYPPQGYRVTDAVWLGDDRLMTLNRRVTIYDGFTAKLAIVDISGDRQSGVSGKSVSVRVDLDGSCII